MKLAKNPKLNLAVKGFKGAGKLRVLGTRVKFANNLNYQCTCATNFVSVKMMAENVIAACT